MAPFWIPLYWLSAVGVLYTYVGYPLIITLLARWRPRPTKTADITPSVTVLVAAYNEDDCIEAKIENTLALDYPLDKLELVVVADGSTDRTNEIVAAYPDDRVRLFYQPQRQGKAAALLRAFPRTKGEVIVFSDANSYFPADALRNLVRHFADPDVGGVGGAKRMLEKGKNTARQGEGIYWRYESYLKACDSAVSSVMGVPGEIWAARRRAYSPPDRDSILEDFTASMRMVAAGWRVVFEPQALAYEEASPSLNVEWTRRTRNVAGGWQAFWRLPEMLRHESALVTFQYVSHRMLRWMVTPSLFVLLLLGNALLLTRPFYAWTLALQLLFYGCAGLGWLLAERGKRVGWLLAPFYVCMLNAAALVGGWRFLRGRQSVVWKKLR